jgi:hypothetical protein
VIKILMRRSSVPFAVACTSSQTEARQAGVVRSHSPGRGFFRVRGAIALCNGIAFTKVVGT